ncbi:hypothetical protein IP95_00330 [Extensimonas vulgaris]|uniref:Uncharacterized protein n=1 Tax=Extensimonas vulgaris TaxID=1031594 RepID=A0A369AND1_9BURK|nr:hypothetical protein DFR45_102301 [Extensimonas vulgaris]TWI41571.1 hypothetical protein IP95_00330 [Extensimonas vulgaris]
MLFLRHCEGRRPAAIHGALATAPAHAAMTGAFLQRAEHSEGPQGIPPFLAAPRSAAPGGSRARDCLSAASFARPRRARAPQVALGAEQAHRDADSRVAFFCLLFLARQEKKVRRRAHIPASSLCPVNATQKLECDLNDMHGACVTALAHAAMDGTGLRRLCGARSDTDCFAVAQNIHQRPRAAPFHGQPESGLCRARNAAAALTRLCRRRGFAKF